jgi:hypothetical protein
MRRRAKGGSTQEGRPGDLALNTRGQRPRLLMFGMTRSHPAVVDVAISATREWQRCRIPTRLSLPGWALREAGIKAEVRGAGRSAATSLDAREHRAKPWPTFLIGDIRR